MYTVPVPDKKVLDRHFSLYAGNIKESVQEIISGKDTFGAGRANGLNLTIKYQGNPKSPAGRFLLSLLNDEDLRILLTGCFKDVVNRFGYIFSDLRNSSGVSKDKYPTNNDKDEVEDLNEIAYHIFVESGYESILNKEDIISEKNLRICPYCGSEKIYVHTKEDGTVIKPTLDHYLPKRKFPWLAMNYHNLVPACWSCNNSPNKHTLSPISKDLQSVYLPHPYNFSDADFSFLSYKKLPEMKRTEINMDIRIDYNKPELHEGYNKIIGIESLYQKMNEEAYGIWQSVVRNCDTYREFLGKIVNPRVFKKLLGPENILNFDINEYNSRIFPEYKFKKDLYQQFMADIFYKKIF